MVKKGALNRQRRKNVGKG
jgi:hypothetical protein